jgi:2-C-methyl-D-erythritol 4-phosphate cytidylyltransferase
VSAIVPAAGQGIRLGCSLPKAFVSVAGKPLLEHTLLNLSKAFRFDEIIIAVSAKHIGRAEKLAAHTGLGNVRVVRGGATRAESVLNALRTVRNSSALVAVHDAARPLVSKRLVKALVAAAAECGAAIAALPATATVKRVRKGRVTGTEDREALMLAQTPQVFRTKLLVARYARLGAKALKATDEAALFDGSGQTVRAVPGEVKNIKVTTPEDLKLFAYYLNNMLKNSSLLKKPQMLGADRGTAETYRKVRRTRARGPQRRR